MPYSFRKLYTLIVTLFVTGASWPASQPQPMPANLLSTPNLRRLTRQSGYIFAGTVTAVERVASSKTVPIMRITFRVDQAMRGLRDGQICIIHEWAGLWESGERYRRGERVLLFLYRPSKLGLTSPVAGQQGRFELDSSGMVILRQEQIAVVVAHSIFTDAPARNDRLSVADFTRAIHQAEEE
jgi:hypothetical protein